MNPTAALDEERLRREVIAAALLELAERHGGALSWDDLANLPLPDGSLQRVVDPGKGGIWNPRDFFATLSIITSPDGPYPDREEGGMLQYHYQRGPEGGKNLKLQQAMELNLPLIRLNKIAKGAFVPIFPVYVVGNNPIAREFTISLDENLRAIQGGERALSPLERTYAERLVNQRVHQPAFRARVLLAYDRSCAICSLRHPELLDAAHIIEDRDPYGTPLVSNGLSLCKIHHAAYDRNFLGISPSYEIRINASLLNEVDGPMLRHGLQEMHGSQIHVPERSPDRPDRDRLAVRFDRFLSA